MHSLLGCHCGLYNDSLFSDAMNDAVRTKFQDSSQRLYTDSLRKKMLNGGIAGMNGVNGTIANGHIPRKMNINVNPLSEMETLSHATDSSNHYPVSIKKQ